MTVPITPQPQRWIVTGRRGAGKTTFCRKLAERARALGWDVAGILSPVLLEMGRKTGIVALDLRRGESRLLASAQPRAGCALRLGIWWFDPDTLAWGNQVLAAALPCDLLIVDEIGPLELELGQGWTAARDALAGTSYRLALAVVRPEYCADFQERWSGSQVLTIGSPAQAEELAEGGIGAGLLLP